MSVNASGDPLAQLRAFMATLDQHRRTFLCSPADHARVEEYLRQLPLECMAGLITVRSNSEIPAGTLYVFNSATEFMTMPPLGRYYPPEVPLYFRYPELRERWDW